MRFSKEEVRDLLAAWILISLAFAILFTQDFSQIFSYAFLIAFVISLLTAGIGFLLHELMHKVVAQRYGLIAHFKAFYGMILFAIVAAFAGFIFAAPGAVMISGMITREKNGKIAIAGPITNIVLAIIFLVPYLLFPTSGYLNLFLQYGFRINALLAAFNMIPAGPFDGAKVIAWSKPGFFITLIISLILLVASFIL